jgi:hypothetical protein
MVTFVIMIIFVTTFTQGIPINQKTLSLVTFAKVKGQVQVNALLSLLYA